MKTTYPPIQAEGLNEWFQHIYTARDDEDMLKYASLERQLVALQAKLRTCKVKEYYPLKGKIDKIKRQLEEQKKQRSWNNYLSK